MMGPRPSLWAHVDNTALMEDAASILCALPVVAWITCQALQACSLKPNQALFSDPPNLSQLTSQPEKGIPRVRECFPFHNSLRGMGFHFFFFSHFILSSYMVISFL